MNRKLRMALLALLILLLTPSALAAESRAYNSVAAVYVDGVKLSASDWMVELVAGVDREIVIEMTEASEPGVLAKPQGISNPFKDWFTVVSQPTYAGGKGTLVVRAEKYSEGDASQSINLSGDSGNSYYKAFHFRVIPGLSEFAPAKKTLDLTVGASHTFGYSIAPSSRADTPIAFASSNAAVASVSKQGLIKGIAAGTATITATSAKDKKSISMSITVKAVNSSLPAVSGVKLAARKNDWNRVSLSWDAVKGATGYRVYTRNSNNSAATMADTWELLDDVKKTSKLVSIVPDINRAKMDFHYAYRVVAYNEKGEGSFPTKDAARIAIQHLAPSQEGQGMVTTQDGVTRIKLQAAGYKKETTLRYTAVNSAQPSAQSVSNTASYTLPGNAKNQEFVTFIRSGADASDAVPSMSVLHFGSYSGASVSNAAFWDIYSTSNVFLRTELKFTKYKDWDAFLEIVGKKRIYSTTTSTGAISISVASDDTLQYVRVAPYTRVNGRPLYGEATKAAKG